MIVTNDNDYIETYSYNETNKDSNDNIETHSYYNYNDNDSNL